MRSGCERAACASRSWSRTVPILLDAEPSPCCSSRQQRRGARAARVEQLAAGRQQRLRAAGEVVELRLDGGDAVARLAERRGELALPALDGAQARVHEPPGAVGDLLHDVGELARLADRGVDLLARRLGERELARSAASRPG